MAALARAVLWSVGNYILPALPPRRDTCAWKSVDRKILNKGAPFRTSQFYVFILQLLVVEEYFKCVFSLSFILCIFRNG